MSIHFKSQRRMEESKCEIEELKFKIVSSIFYIINNSIASTSNANKTNNTSNNENLLSLPYVRGLYRTVVNILTIMRINRVLGCYIKEISLIVSIWQLVFLKLTWHIDFCWIVLLRCIMIYFFFCCVFLFNNVSI